MNKKLLLCLLFFILGLPLHAQKFPVKFLRPGFSPGAKTVKMHTLERKIRNAARHEGISSPKKLTQEATKSTLIQSIFRAYPEDNTSAHAFSGFIFQTNYQGKDEIFGVVAQHAVLGAQYSNGIGLSFTARVLQNGRVVDIPAQIVKRSATSTFDIALVKFRPEDEKWLHPLTLADQEPALDELLHLTGFGTEQLSLLTDSPLLEKSLFNLRFPMAGDPLEWPGLCGSPVLNAQSKVVGIMTGAARKVSDPSYYTGYATRNSYLRLLVAAYHDTTGQITFPLMLDGEKIVDLRLEEFVSYIRLRDENGKTIFSKTTSNKFPFSTIMEHLASARYIELYVNYMWWTGYMLAPAKSSSDARYVVYDLQEKQIITEKNYTGDNPWK